MHTDEPGATIGSQGEPGILHPDLRKDMLREKVAERLAARTLDRLADPIDADAVIPPVAWIEDQRQHQRGVLAGDDTRCGCLFHVSAHLRAPDVVDEARSMGNQMSQGDLLPRRAQLRLAGGVETFEHLWRGEFRQHLGDWPVERELALLDEPHCRRRGDRLCHRGDPKHCIDGHCRPVG